MNPCACIWVNSGKKKEIKKREYASVSATKLQHATPASPPADQLNAETYLGSVLTNL